MPERPKKILFFSLLAIDLLLLVFVLSLFFLIRGNLNAPVKISSSASKLNFFQRFFYTKNSRKEIDIILGDKEEEAFVELPDQQGIIIGRIKDNSGETITIASRGSEVVLIVASDAKVYKVESETENYEELSLAEIVIEARVIVLYQKKPDGDLAYSIGVY